MLFQEFSNVRETLIIMGNRIQSALFNFRDNKKRKLRAVVPVLGLIVAVAALFLLRLPGYADEISPAIFGDPESDLAFFVVAPISVYDATTGQKIEDSTFFLGNNYSFHVGFRDSADRELRKEMTYQIPKGLMITSMIPVTKDIMVGSEKVGSFTVYPDGLIEVALDDLFVAPGNLGARYLVLIIDAHFTGSCENTDLDFGNNVTIKVNVAEPQKTSGINLEKTSSGYDASTRTIDYKVRISNPGNVPVDLDHFKDSVTGFYPFPTDSGLIERIFLTSVSIDWGGKSQSNLTAGDITWVMPGVRTVSFQIDFTDITLDPGDYIEISYTTDVAPLINYYSNNPGNGVSSSMNYLINLSNRAEISGFDDDGNPLSDHAELNITCQSQILLKYGYINEGSNKGWIPGSGAENKLTWYVVAGNGFSDLRGATLTETFGAHQTIHYTGAPDVYPHVRVTLYTGPINMPHSSSYIIGHYDGFFPAAADKSGITTAMEFELTGGGTGFTFRIPEKIEFSTGAYTDNGDKILYAVFQIIVDLEPESYTPNNTAFYNTAKVGLKDGSGDSVTIGVDVGTPKVESEKSGLLMDPNAEYKDGYIEWTVSTFIPRYFSGETVWFMDRCFPFDGGDWKQLLSYLDYIDVVSVTYTNTKAVNANFTEYNIIARNQDAFYFYFGKGTTNPAASKSPFTEDTRLTIKYRLSLGALLSEPEGMTLRQMLHMVSAQGTWSLVRNAFYVYFPGLDEALLSYQCDVKWPVRKQAVSIEGSTINYLVSVYPKRAGYDFLASPIITDALDPKLEYIEGTFRVYSRYTGKYYGWYDEHENDLLYEALINDREFKIDLSNNNMRVVRFDSTENKCVVDYGAAVESDWYRLKPVGEDADMLHIYYSARLKPGYVDTHPVSNMILVGDFDAVTNNVVGTPFVKKEMSANGNIASVEIIINPDGAKIVFKDDFNSYEVIDRMSDTLSFYIDSIEVLRKNTNNSPQSDWYAVPELAMSNSGNIWTYRLMGDNTIKFIIPDETPVKIVYKALITIPPGGSGTITNSVEVNGFFSDEVSQPFTVNDATASGGAGKGKLRLIKHDSEDSARLLPGAKFGIYIDVRYSGYDTIIQGIPAEWRAPYMIGEKLFYIIGIAETDSDGYFSFTSGYLAYDNVFALVELQPPRGYKAPDDPVTLFTYQPTLAGPSTILGDRIILLSTGFMQISNELSDTPPGPGGPVLPETGGSGSGVFVLAGFVLMALAGLGFVILRFGSKRSSTARD